MQKVYEDEAQQSRDRKKKTSYLIRLGLPQALTMQEVYEDEDKADDLQSWTDESNSSS